MRKMLQECAVLLGLLVCASDLDAQTVQQTGSVTSGHMTCWSTTGVIKDCGSAASPVATSIGVLASGPGICQQSGPSSGAFNRICLTASSTAAGVAMTNVGGATGGFTLTLNGVTQGIATVTLPVTTGDVACFADNTGTLNDCGGAGSGLIVTNHAVAIGTGIFGFHSAGPGTTGQLFQGLTGSDAFFSNAVSLNTGTLQSALTGTVVRLANADGVITRLELDSYAQPGVLSCVRADTTAAAPSALQANDEICSLNGFGYDGTGFSATAAAAYRMYAAGVWSNTSHPSYARIATTTTSSTTLTDRFGIEQDGGITAPPSVTGGSKGVGTFNTSGNYYVNGVGFRTVLTSTLTLNASTSGSGTACTVGAPCTIAQAISNAINNYDAAGGGVIIQLANGTYTGANVTINGNVLGGRAAGNASQNQLTIQGDCTNSANVTVNGSSASAFTLVGIVYPVNIQCMTITTTTSGNGILADFGSKVYYAKIIWGASANGADLVATFGSMIEQEGVETISGNRSAHWLVIDGSQILTTGQTITCTGSPAFSGGFVSIANNSTFTLNGAAFSGCGTATGTKYLADTTSTFGAGTADPNTVFPGSLNGTTTGTIYGNQIFSNSIGTTSTDAVILTNPTAAAAGAQQMSPRLRLTGQGWKTNATAASETVDWIIENLPVQGTADPTSNLNVSYQVNSGGYVQKFNFFSNGVFNAGTGYQIGGAATSGNVLRGNGTNFISAQLSATDLTGILPLANGGTSANLTASNGGIVWSNASQLQILAGTATAGFPLLSGSTAAPSWATITYPASATSGGVPYFSSTTVMASSAVMSAQQIMSGGGAGNPPVVSPCILGTGTSLSCSSALTFTPQFVLANTTSDASSPQFVFTKSRSGGNTNTGDQFMDFLSQGFSNSGFQSSGRIQMLQAAASSGNNIPSKIVFTTSNASGQLNLSMTLDNAGTLTIPNGVASTSKTTGTLIVTGGIGNSGAHYTDTLNIITVANAATTAALCWNSGTGLVTENGAVGTCTVSLLAAKDLIRPLTNREGFDLVMALEPWRYTMKPDLPTWVAGEQIGFVADYADKLDIAQPVVAHNHDGSLGGFRYEQYTAALTAAFKYLKADNDNLRERIEALETRRTAR